MIDDFDDMMLKEPDAAEEIVKLSKSFVESSYPIRFILMTRNNCDIC